MKNDSLTSNKAENEVLFSEIVQCWLWSGTRWYNLVALCGDCKTSQVLEFSLMACYSKQRC